MPKFVITTAEQLRDSQEKRAKLHADAQKIVEAAGDGSLTAEQEQQFDALMGEFSDRMAAEQDYRRVADRRAQLEQAGAALAETRGRLVRPAPPGGVAETLPMPQFRGQAITLRGAGQQRRATREYADAFRSYLGGVQGAEAALQTDIDNQGGFLAPPQYVAELIATLDNTFWFRRLARVLPPTTAPKVTMPRRTARMSAFQWGSELSTPTADTGLKFGTYTLAPHYMTGEIEVSKDFVAASVLDADSLVRGEIVFQAGELEEDAFFNGDGNNKPLGIFVASSNGISSGRDKSGALTDFDLWYDAKYHLSERYLRSPNLRWVLHRAAIKTIAKLKSTTGEPIWTVSTRDGEPDRLLGIPVILSEYAPDGTDGVYGSGDYVGILGDFGYYDILDGLDMGITRLTDSYYERRNMVGFVVRRKVDGCPRLEDAFVRVKKS